MILTHNKYKIALIGYRLGQGGAEKVMANLSIFFEKIGIEVHNIIVLDEVSYPFSGKLVNLGLLKNESNDFFNKLKRLNALRKYIKANDFDFIIDFRFRIKPLQELFLSRMIYKSKGIFTIHSFLIDHYLPNNSWFTRLIYQHCYANVAITKQIQELIINRHKLKNVFTIYNPVNSEEINLMSSKEINLDFDYIIAIGQYESSIKQFDKLITSYSNSILPNKQIHLVILGNGDKNFLRKVVSQNKVEDKVHLLGYQNNPFKYLKRARFLVLSSKNEGLPNVILESLACKTPVVSFDCSSGPKEIITDKINGILVENQNFEKLTDAINLLVTDENLYQFCKQNSLESIKPFMLDNIGKQWLDLLRISFNTKNGNT